jgi:hypothetical protein
MVFFLGSVPERRVLLLSDCLALVEEVVEFYVYEDIAVDLTDSDIDLSCDVGIYVDRPDTNDNALLNPAHNFA